MFRYTFSEHQRNKLIDDKDALNLYIIYIYGYGKVLF